MLLPFFFFFFNKYNQTVVSIHAGFLNYFLTILAFTIYKSYYVSEQKTKTIDVYLLFKNEFQRKMKKRTKNYYLYMYMSMRRCDARL
jgi:hypothetical protein